MLRGKKGGGVFLPYILNALGGWRAGLLCSLCSALVLLERKAGGDVMGIGGESCSSFPSELPRPLYSSRLSQKVPPALLASVESYT